MLFIHSHISITYVFVSTGVGSNVNKSLLDAISGGPENVLEVNSFSELYTLALPLEQLVAKAASELYVNIYKQIYYANVFWQ
jgi:hypothetical protein